jgi:hypothetical protein
VLIAASRERIDDSSRRNVLLLVLCQATFMSTTSLTATVASLAGYALATDKALATLPITAGVAGTAVGTIPASLLHHRGWGAVLSTAVPVLGLATAAILAGAWRGTLPARQEQR